MTCCRYIILESARHALNHALLSLASIAEQQPERYLMLGFNNINMTNSKLQADFCWVAVAKKQDSLSEQQVSS
jgi:hypothetical protein